MSKAVKFLTVFLSAVIIVAAWGMYTTLSIRLESEQEKLLAHAREFVNNKIYDKGISAFRAAIETGVGDKASILYELANVYKDVESLSQYRGILQELIDETAVPLEMELSDLYMEAAEYDLVSSTQVTDLLDMLKDGIKKTGDMRLIELYEENRYVALTRQGFYDEAGVISGGTGLVSVNGLWGYVDAKGSMMLKPSYDLATNFKSYAVVQKDGELYIINGKNTRQAVADFAAADIARFDGASFSVKLDGQDEYVLANWQGGENIYITKGEAAYQFIGLSSDGIRAVKKENKWALIDQSNRKEYIAPDYIYEDVALDELGRCAVNGAVFAKENGQYYLMDYTGKKAETSFDDANPFFEKDGFAAVKKGEKWGFVNAAGDVLINFIYDDAGSSSLGLAPVKIGDLWGYITLEDRFMGNTAIEPQYYGAKQFVKGCAPVKGENGWYYIMLEEYE